MRIGIFPLSSTHWLGTQATRRPPGRSTRWASSSSLNGSCTCSRVSKLTTTSTELSVNPSSRSASAFWNSTRPRNLIAGARVVDRPVAVVDADDACRRAAAVKDVAAVAQSGGDVEHRVPGTDVLEREPIALHVRVGAPARLAQHVHVQVAFRVERLLGILEEERVGNGLEQQELVRTVDFAALVFADLEVQRMLAIARLERAALDPLLARAPRRPLAAIGANRECPGHQGPQLAQEPRALLGIHGVAHVPHEDGVELLADDRRGDPRGRRNGPPGSRRPASMWTMRRASPPQTRTRPGPCRGEDGVEEELELLASRFVFSQGRSPPCACPSHRQSNIPGTSA
jgi:hypothetical protein